MDQQMIDLLRSSRGGDSVADIWPDYPCVRCKTMIEGNGDACKCYRWRLWFGRVWSTFYRGGKKK